jgi:hypothetical protein
MFGGVDPTCGYLSDDRRELLMQRMQAFELFRTVTDHARTNHWEYEVHLAYNTRLDDYKVEVREYGGGRLLFTFGNVRDWNRYLNPSLPRTQEASTPGESHPPVQMDPSYGSHVPTTQYLRRQEAWEIAVATVVGKSRPGDTIYVEDQEMWEMAAPAVERLNTGARVLIGTVEVTNP